MPRYEVRIRRKVTEWATLEVVAKSPTAARRRALAMVRYAVEPRADEHGVDWCGDLKGRPVVEMMEEKHAEE